jgi:hypothetical protein
MHRLNRIYDEINHDIWSVIELYDRMNSEGLSPQQVIRTTRLIESKISDLESEQARLEERNKHAAWIFRRAPCKIKDSKILEQNRSVYNQLNRGIENLKAEEAGLKNMIDSIWLNDETCVQTHRTVDASGLIINITEAGLRRLFLFIISIAVTQDELINKYITSAFSAM